MYYTPDDILAINEIDPVTGLTYLDRTISEGIASQWQDIYCTGDSTDYRVMLTALRYRSPMSERRRCALAYVGLSKASFCL